MPSKMSVTTDSILLYFIVLHYIAGNLKQLSLRYQTVRKIFFSFLNNNLQTFTNIASQTKTGKN